MPSVIEGVRNPMDFVHAYDPRGDVVIWLDAAAVAIAPTAFERGLDVIATYLAWLEDSGIRDAAKAPVIRYRFTAFRRSDPGAIAGDTLDDAIEDAIKQCALRLGPSGLAQGERQGERVPERVHADIPPMNLHVRAEYLHGMELDLTDVAYHNCVDEKICVHVHDALRGPVLAFLKHKDVWLPGTYHFSIEWWTGNQVLHAIVLEQGQLALLPHHKLKFGPGHSPGFAPYRKLRRTWRV